MPLKPALEKSSSEGRPLRLADREDEETRKTTRRLMDAMTDYFFKLFFSNFFVFFLSFFIAKAHRYAKHR